MIKLEQSKKLFCIIKLIISITCLLCACAWYADIGKFASGFTGVFIFAEALFLGVFLAVSFAVNIVTGTQTGKWSRYLALCINVITLAVLILPFIKVDEQEVFVRREQVVQEIESGQLLPDEQGEVELPDEKKYSGLSDGNSVILALYENRPVIYFYEDRGLLESSRGYLIFSDKIDNALCTPYMDFVNVKEYEGNWYSCSTD